MTPSVTESAVDRHLLVSANEDAARFFRTQLLGPRGAGPRSYLSARGFGAMLEDTPWTLGYAPAGWTSLVGHLRHNGYSDEPLLAAGLACRTRRNTLVDRFRDRITFGIRNGSGELVGFTARCGPSAPATVPKYLNTPTTAIYRKGDVAFGLGEQQSRIRDGAVSVLVEGPLDALAIHLAQEGDERNFAGLALCGTSLSSGLATTLAQVNDRRIVLAFDSDDAGAIATERAARLLAPAFANVLALARHGDGDPADVLTRSGGPTLAGQLRQPGLASDQVLEAHLERWCGHFDHADAKAAFLREAADLIAVLGSANVADHVGRYSKQLEVNTEAVVSDLIEALCGHASRGQRASADRPLWSAPFLNGRAP